MEKFDLSSVRRSITRREFQEYQRSSNRHPGKLTRNKDRMTDEEVLGEDDQALLKRVRESEEELARLAFDLASRREEHRNLLRVEALRKGPTISQKLGYSLSDMGMLIKNLYELWMDNVDTVVKASLITLIASFVGCAGFLFGAVYVIAAVFAIIMGISLLCFLVTIILDS